MQTKTTRPGRRQVSRARIARLLGEGHLSYRQVAEAAGCSLKTVSRIADETKLDNSQQDRLDELQRHLEASLPSEARAKGYVALTKRIKDSPMVVLKTLERVDSLLGIVTESERIRSLRPQDPAPNQYLFFMPAGARVQVVATVAEPALVRESEAKYVDLDNNCVQETARTALDVGLERTKVDKYALIGDQTGADVVGFEPTASPGRHPQPVAPTSADDPKG